MEQQVAVVVGGANGIGRAVVDQLRAQYQQIAVIDYDEEKLQQIPDVEKFVVDIRDG